jgi:hypothetical protein
MKTKDLIKILMEADPSGECHVGMMNGIPRWAIKNPGYWDGNYSYIDEGGNFVTSEEGSRIDLWGWDIDEYVESLVDSGLTLDEIKGKFKFKLLGGEERNRETITRILDKVEESYKEWR